MPEAVLDLDAGDTGALLLDVIARVKEGDFSARLPLDWTGVPGKVADGLNDVIIANQALERELARLSELVGTQGQLSQRATLGGQAHGWSESVGSVNSLIECLAGPVSEMQDVIGAVAAGDLSKKVSADVRGEMLDLKNTINGKVDQLNVFVSEVMRVAREVGTEGKFGQAAAVSLEVRGVWKDVIESMNLMAGNLTGQVRNIAEVTTAVANGDLSTKITIDAKGEFLELKANTLARFGGDEFAVLSPNIGDERRALAVGARIQTALDAPFQLKSVELMATASIGIAIGDAGTDGADLLRDADAAMYRAKDNGRNRVALFDEEMQRNAQDHLDRAAALHGALENHEIEAHYQPIVELVTGRVVGVEALARWRRQSGELVAPDSFIELAEEIALIEPLGEHILRTACRDALAWSRSSPAPFMLSVNVSPRQFASGDLASMVLSALAETGFDATCLHLEITESALMNEPSVQTTIGELRKHGIKFAIDDFGTGYSSLASLRELPVDILKIDRSFVTGITTNTQDRALIRAAIDLARSFGPTTIAEGVETQEQLRELTALGCDLAQGYLWNRPVQAEEVADVMENVGKITHDRLVLAHH